MDLTLSSYLARDSVEILHKFGYITHQLTICGQSIYGQFCQGVGETAVAVRLWDFGRGKGGVME